MNSNHLLGIGLRANHYEDILSNNYPIGWLEVHSENFFYGHKSLSLLKKIREKYNISLHGVGLSLGSADGVTNFHLEKLKDLIDELDPFLISEHLSWSRINGQYAPDLLPIPYNQESMDIFCKNIDATQKYLQKEILIENPSSYIEYYSSNIQEYEFLPKICELTGAKILLDVNNIFVSCHNHGWDPKFYIDNIPKNYVKEIHIAGHSSKEIQDTQVFIDTHDDYPKQEVWELYGYAISRFGQVHSLLEWDAKIPTMSELVEEVKKAEYYLKEKVYEPT